MTTTITTTVNSPVINSMGYDEWWCPCGIEPSDVVAAYQPKGVASFSASLVNIANPGTYDAIDPGGSNTPDWNTTDGWVGASNKYLISSIFPMGDQSWSMVVSFLNCASGGYVCGSQSNAMGVQIYGISRMSVTNIVYGNGNLHAPPDLDSGGIFGFSGNKAYKNGVVLSGTINTSSGMSIEEINPIGWNNDGSYSGNAVNIFSEVWYNKVLTPQQMYDVYTAMAAL